VIYTDADRGHSVMIKDFVANGYQASDLGLFIL